MKGAVDDRAPQEKSVFVPRFRPCSLSYGRGLYGQGLRFHPTIGQRLLDTLHGDASRAQRLQGIILENNPTLPSDRRRRVQPSLGLIFPKNSPSVQQVGRHASPVAIKLDVMVFKSRTTKLMVLAESASPTRSNARVPGGLAGDGQA